MWSAPLRRATGPAARRTQCQKQVGKQVIFEPMPGGFTGACILAMLLINEIHQYVARVCPKPFLSFTRLCQLRDPK